MTKRDGIFAGENPFAITRAWLTEARASEVADADAAALATVDSDGLPNVRVVLMRGIEDDAFVFYTNYEGKKAQELDASGQAAFVLHWKSLKRQIRVRGAVEREDGPTADAYYNARPHGSRIGAWASRQSRPLESREQLIADVERETKRLGQDPARPPFWGGYRIRPIEFEFWADGEFRLHNRFRWTRKQVNADWIVQRLYP